MFRKKTIDMTRGPIAAPLFYFILPMIGGSLFQQLYNTVDFLFVGNFLNARAAAAVGASSTLINCIIGLFSGISVGTSVVIAQAIGGKRKEEAQKALHTSVAFGLLGGLFLMLLGLLLSPYILSLLHTPEEVIPHALVYFRIYLLSLPPLIFYNMVAGSLRAEGDSASPFYVLVLCGSINVILDALFILLIPMGVAGVALATTGSQVLSALLIAYLASHPDRQVMLRRKELAIDREVLKRVLYLGLPTGFQTIIITISNVIVQYYINGFGETAVAAFATYYKVENLNYLPIMAFGQAATSFAGQNKGAGKYDRIKKGSWLTSILGSLLVFCSSMTILFFGKEVFGFFMKDEDVVREALVLASVSFPFYCIYPFLEVMGGAVRGMGYAISSMLVIVCNLCILRVFVLVIGVGRFHSLPAIAAAYPITWAGAAATFIILFTLLLRREKRKYRLLMR